MFTFNIKHLDSTFMSVYIYNKIKRKTEKRKKDREKKHRRGLSESFSSNNNKIQWHTRSNVKISCFHGNGKQFWTSASWEDGSKMMETFPSALLSLQKRDKRTVFSISHRKLTTNKTTMQHIQKIYIFECWMSPKRTAGTPKYSSYNSEYFSRFSSLMRDLSISTQVSKVQIIEMIDQLLLSMFVGLKEKNNTSSAWR